MTDDSGQANHRAQSVLASLGHWNNTQPQKILFTFVDDDGSLVAKLTYADLSAKSEVLAQHLLSTLKLCKGDVCLLVYPPSLDFIVALIACMRAGVIAVPVFPPDPRRLKKDLQMFVAIQASCKAKVALTNQAYNFAKKVADIKNMFTTGSKWPDLQWALTDDLTGAAPKEATPLPPPALTDVAFLQYTSGSTSEPKGVMISHGNLADNLRLIVTGLAAGTDTVVVSWLPQYHDMGLIGSYLGCLHCGGSGYYMSPLTFIRRPVLWVELMSKHRATHMQAPNFAYGLVARKFLAADPQPDGLDLSCVRHMINAAEPVDALGMDRFYSVFESHGLKRGVIYPTYGLAESTVYVCSNGTQRLCVNRLLLETEQKVKLVEKLELWAYNVDESVKGGPDEGVKTASLVGCGAPADSEGLDLRIVDTETSEALSEGQVGEIWLRGPSVALGYWDSPEQTKETFGGQLAPGAASQNGSGAGAYLRTGDLGFLWEGELFICGRSKDLVIIRGRNHYPQDIERCAEEACLGTLRGGCSAAFAVPIGSGGAAEGLVLVAEVSDAAADKGSIVRDVRQALAAAHGVNLAAVALLKPRTVPKTTSGKIARSWCKRGYLEGTLEVLHKWHDEDFAQTDDEVETGELAEPKPEPAPEGVLSPADMTEAQILTRVVEAVAKILKLDPGSIPTDACLTSLGLDSMDAMQLLATLEDKFGVKIPEEIMLDAETSLSTLAPVIKSGGILKPRSVLYDCAKIAEMELFDGPPKSFETLERLEVRRRHRADKCSGKAGLKSGRFRPGTLAEKVPQKGFPAFMAVMALVTVMGSALYIPLFLALVGAYLGLRTMTFVYLGLLPLSFVMRQVFTGWPPGGRYSKLRIAMLRHFSFRVVLDAPLSPSGLYVFAGLDHGIVSQLLSTTALPSVTGVLAHPCFKGTFPLLGAPLSLSPLFSMVTGVLGATADPLHCLRHGQSVGLKVDISPYTLGDAVKLAMQTGAEVVPCCSFGGGRFTLIPTRYPIALACGKPFRVPRVDSPTPEVVKEYADILKTQLRAVQDNYEDAYHGRSAAKRKTE